MRKSGTGGNPDYKLSSKNKIRFLYFKMYLENIIYVIDNLLLNTNSFMIARQL